MQKHKFSFLTLNDEETPLDANRAKLAAILKSRTVIRMFFVCDRWALLLF